MSYKTIVWFRQDLRLSDNPALSAAAQKGSIMPVYIFDQSQADFKMGAVSCWWLHHSLLKLDEQLQNGLGIFVGKPLEIINDLIAKNDIDAVYWNRCYEPWHVKDDAEIKSVLIEKGIECESFKGSLLYEPWEVMKSDGSSYKVFTPFYKCLLNNERSVGKPLAKPKNIDIIKCDTISVDELNLIPKINWYKQIEQTWQVGEDNAHLKLEEFIENGLRDYNEGRNFPSKEVTSKLSPHLHFGEISPRQVWNKILDLIEENKRSDKNFLGRQGFVSTNAYKFLSELGWREFSYYLLFNFPELPRKNFQRKFDNFVWENNQHFFEAWKKGQTGYPIIDAGMRELWQTGYMHNRIRMVAGSFLVKNLLIHWHKGAEWFWNCLVDADLANNSMNWQWIAGCGADSAPYFRIFNPVLQGEKFDADGEYTKFYVPELKDLPTKYLFKPWEAPKNILQAAGIKLGENYPRPIVDLSISRNLALVAYKKSQSQYADSE